MNINTITHNKSINETLLGYDEGDRGIYLNTINMKACNIESRLENKNIIDLKIKDFMKNEDKFIKNIDDKMVE
jgi:hypothetical protein